MNNNAKDHKIYLIPVFFIVLILISIVGYSLGYRIKSNLSIGKIGKVELSIPYVDTLIFVDESKKISTKKADEIVEVALSPGSHSVIVSKEGYFPWTKKFVVPSGNKIVISPLFISSNTAGEVITQNDPEYYKIRNSVITNQSPTKDSPITSNDGTSKLWLEDNAIMVEIGSTTKNIIQPDTIIRNVGFYKKRSDVIIFSNQGSIYAIESDTDGVQNFMPIYRGQNPSFTMADENTIYVIDGQALMQIVI